jgi:hypothetical protein
MNSPSSVPIGIKPIYPTFNLLSTGEREEHPPSCGIIVVENGIRLSLNYGDFGGKYGFNCAIS